MRVVLIVNPNAGGGQARRRVPTVTAAFKRLGISCDVAETTRPGDATRLASSAGDVDVLAVMGGDGTLNEVSRCFIDSEGKPVDGPALGLIPHGTGGDFRRSFEIPTALDAAVQRIAQGTERNLDLAKAEFINNDGARRISTFVNVGSCGISGAVTRLVNSSSKALGGKLSFYLASARATLGYANAAIKLSVDGEVVHSGRTYLAAIANGRYFGGGMLIAPNADPQDGVLDAIILGDLSKPAAFGLTPRIYEGTHIETPKAKTFRGKHFEIVPWPSVDAPWLELDGESLGQVPLRIEVLPAAVRLRC